MRLTASLLALALLAAAVPLDARAQAGAPRVAPAVPSPSPQAPVFRPAVPRGAAPGPYPRTVPAPQVAHPYAPPSSYHPHFWWGFGFGWGWYPLYGYSAPPPPGAYVPLEPQEPDRIYTRFSVYGAGQSDGYMAGLDFGIDGRYTGFNLDVSALAVESVTGPMHHSGSDPAAWGTMHFTWSFVSARSVRMRLELGGSMLSLPNSAFVAAQQWRDKTLFGPDFGISGQLGLVGPVGIEGHARLTPYPQLVADALIAATIHGGPVGISGGWRWIDVEGDERDAPKLTFRGPQVSLALAF